MIYIDLVTEYLELAQLHLVSLHTLSCRKRSSKSDIRFYRKAAIKALLVVDRLLPGKELQDYAGKCPDVVHCLVRAREAAEEVPIPVLVLEATLDACR